jgi:hypothetical protein
MGEESAWLDYTIAYGAWTLTENLLPCVDVRIYVGTVIGLYMYVYCYCRYHTRFRDPGIFEQLISR